MTNAKAKTYDGYTAKSFKQATIKDDGSTVVDIEYEVSKPVLKSLDVDNVHYFPVVTQFTGVKFYNDEQEEITPASTTGYEMSDLTNAHFYSGDVSFTAVRSINTVSYNTVYGADATPGAKEVDPTWATANLKTDESVEKLPEALDRASNPKIGNIELTTIWKAFNKSKLTDGFGGSSGRFWSCVALHERTAWSWISGYGESGAWNDDVARDGRLCVCVSRAFN